MIKSSRWLADVDWNSVMKGENEMPFDVDPYESYIHDEFKNIAVKDSISSQKYDKLFDFFSYLRTDSTNLDFVNCYSMILERKSVHSIKNSLKHS